MNFKGHPPLPPTAGASARVLGRRLRYRIHAGLQHLGAPGSVAVGLVAFCVMIWSTEIQKQIEDMEAIERDLNVLAQPFVNTKRIEAQQSELTTFDAVLPHISQLATVIGQLHSHAKAANVPHALADFHDTELAAAMPAVMVTVDITATHEQTVQFLNLVLADLPSAALEAITFKRATLADTALETRVRFRIFVRTS